MACQSLLHKAKVWQKLPYEVNFDKPQLLCPKRYSKSEASLVILVPQAKISILVKLFWNHFCCHATSPSVLGARFGLLQDIKFFVFFVSNIKISKRNCSIYYRFSSLIRLSTWGLRPQTASNWKNNDTFISESRKVAIIKWC